jgi:hypothetical protein
VRTQIQPLEELAGQGIVMVEVKTLDATAGYEPYIATRAFWERRGFVQIDCIDPLPGWGSRKSLCDLCEGAPVDQSRRSTTTLPRSSGSARPWLSRAPSTGHAILARWRAIRATN